MACLYWVHRLEVALRDVAGQVVEARSEVRSLMAKLGEDEGSGGGLDGDGAEIRFGTTAEAEAEIGKLGEAPGAEQLAEAIGRIDSWLVVPEEEGRLRGFKLAQLDRLRRAVRIETEAHQRAALGSATGEAGAKEHAEAGRILVLYPMSDEPAVIAEAKGLAAGQADVAGRLEALRRQRYNRWAVEQVEKAIDSCNKNKSVFGDDDPALLKGCTECLSEVDPALLEPIALDLYNYAIQITKDCLQEHNKVELAKRMTDPGVRRKAMGDF